jgi:hypothetical protein
MMGRTRGALAVCDAARCSGWQEENAGTMRARCGMAAQRMHDVHPVCDGSRAAIQNDHVLTSCRARIGAAQDGQGATPEQPTSRKIEEI